MPHILNGLLTVFVLVGFFSSAQQPFINLGGASHFTDFHLNFVLLGIGGGASDFSQRQVFHS